MNKFLLSALLLAPMALYAQSTATPVATHAAKPANKSVAKPLATKSRTELHSAAIQVAAGVSAAEVALSPAELTIAGRVHQGRLPCELGAFVTLIADVSSPGYFDLQIKNVRYRMFPVETTTGAIRLEDQKAGAVWLQLANKSMLMNQKLGQRLADVCMSPDQVLMAEAMLKNPPPSVLDKPTEIAIK